jgi:hypothetical protein
MKSEPNATAVRTPVANAATAKKARSVESESEAPYFKRATAPTPTNTPAAAMKTIVIYDVTAV